MTAPWVLGFFQGLQQGEHVLLVGVLGDFAAGSHKVMIASAKGLTAAHFFLHHLRCTLKHDPLGTNDTKERFPSPALTAMVFRPFGSNHIT